MQNAVKGDTEAASTDGTASVAHGQTIALLIAITVGVTIFIIPLAMAGIKDFWCGILFLLYWPSFEHMDNQRIAPSLVGVLVGLGFAYLFATLPTLLGRRWAGV